MQHHMSLLQSRALAAIAASDKPLVAGEILDAIGQHKTPATRAALSRALRRLAQNGHIDRLMTHVALSGCGYLYALHDDSRPIASPDFAQVTLRR